MNPDLEAIVAADEEARARIDAARSTSQSQVEATAVEREQRRRERYASLVRDADDDERQIREATDRAVADRQAARARYSETRRPAAEAALIEAADLYARIIVGEPREISK
jgi:hypothetical protein